MPSETEQLKRNVTYWQGQAEEYKQVLGEMMALEQENHEAARELYAVLKQVEYIWDSTQELKICSWCYVLEGESHSDDCPIGNVLDKYSEYGEESDEQQQEAMGF